MKKHLQKSYHWFNQKLLDITMLSWKYSKTTLIIFLVITLFLLSNISKMRIVFTADDLTGQGIKSADELKSIKERYQDGVTSLFILTPPAGQFSFSTEELCQIRKWYSFQKNAMPELLSTTSTFDFKSPQRKMMENGHTRFMVKNLLDLDCENRILKTDPRDVRAALNATPFAMASEKRNQLTLLFQFTFRNSSTSKFGSYDPKQFEELRRSVDVELKPIVPNAKIMWIGQGDYQWYILEGLKFSKYINMGMILFLLIGLRAVFGTWRSGIIYCSTLFLSTIWIFGLKGFVGSTFDIMCTGLVIIVAISSLEDFTFTSYDQFKSGEWKKSTLNILVPGFYTSLTTILGFLSLRVSQIDAISSMGTWAAFGAFVEWILIFWILPCFLKEFTSSRKWVDEKKALNLKFLTHTATKTFPKKIILLSLIVFPMGIYSFFHLNFDESPQDTFPGNHEYTKSIQNLKENKGWMGNVSLLFDEKLKLDEMKSIRDQIVQSRIGKKLIARSESHWDLTDWLAKQGSLDQLESDAYFKLSRIHGQFIDKDERVRILLYVNDVSVQEIQHLKSAVEDICQTKCHLGGEVLTYSDFASLIPHSLMDSLLSSLLQVGFVIGLIAYAQNKAKLIPSLILSSVWGPFLTVILLHFTAIPLDFWRSTFASILVGLTGDNAIQYLFGAEEKDIQDGLAERGSASIITGILMALNSLIYMGSYFSSPKYFGVILCIGLLASLFGDLWLFQGFIPLFQKKKKAH